MNGEISVFKNPPIIGYLTKTMANEYPDKQVGKTIIQKMIFLLVANGTFKFHYSMFHYGPFSSEVAGELDYAENLHIVDIAWEDNKGYFIRPGNNINTFENLLSESEKEKIRQATKVYGALTAGDISILATSIFLKIRFNTPEKDLPGVIQSIKPKYSIEDIRDIITKYSPGPAH